MPSFPNQRTVTTQKELCDKKHPYTMNNIDVLQEAMASLNGNAFKLWMYFAKNQDGFKLESSPTALSQWGVKRSTYYDAWEELKKSGYLEEITPTYYVFHEKPKNEQTVMVEIDKDESTFDF